MGKGTAKIQRLIQRRLGATKMKNFTRPMVVICLFLFYAFLYSCEETFHLVLFTNQINSVNIDN